MRFGGTGRTLRPLEFNSGMGVEDVDRAESEFDPRDGMGQSALEPIQPVGPPAFLTIHLRACLTANSVLTMPLGSSTPHAKDAKSATKMNPASSGNQIIEE